MQTCMNAYTYDHILSRKTRKQGNIGKENEEWVGKAWDHGGKIKICHIHWGQSDYVWVPMDRSSPAYYVHRIFPARILGQIAISSSRESSQPRDWIRVSCVSCIADTFLSESISDIKKAPKSWPCYSKPFTVLSSLIFLSSFPISPFQKSCILTDLG